MTGQSPASQQSVPPGQSRNRFGTFGGVFTPSILTIFGVIMFVRAGFVVGQAGVLGALAVLCIANCITLLTALSVSAISTNTAVRGGGAYFLISRVMGPECGGAIGVTLFLAQAVSVPFYVLGFSEAVVRTFPALAPHFQWLSLGTAGALFMVAVLGAGWAIRTQYLILAILGLAIAAFLGGLAMKFDPSNLASNLHSRYSGADHSFWVLFAIYFPAVTGMMAGVNMSGDLRDPARSLPRGTLAAVGVSFAVYALQIVLMGAGAERETLVNRSYEVLLDSALLGASFVVVGGMFAATLSSGLGSMVGAPRVLQALARDDILPLVRPFSRGSRRGDEPRRALFLTGLITAGVLWYAGNGESGNAFNLVASVITMFFLFTYGMTNLSAFVESFGRNPSFRPRFRLYHWSTALLGAAGCGVTAFLIDPRAAAAATAVIAVILYYVSRRRLRSDFGDARRGFLFSRVRDNLLRLAALPSHAKNWRPTVLVLSGNPENRLALVRYGAWLESNRGILMLADIIQGRAEEIAALREEALRRLEKFIAENRLAAFPEALVSEDFDSGLRALLQAHSIGPIKANVVLLGWPGGSERFGQYFRLAGTVRALGMSLVVARSNGLPGERPQKRIDVWWRGMENGSLMVILAYLLSRNPEWNGSRIRLLRAVGTGTDMAVAEAELRELAAAGRIDAEVRLAVSDRPFSEVFREESRDSAAAFLGFPASPQGDAGEFHARFEAMLSGMPTVLLVASSGEADLMA